MVKLIVFVLEH